MCQIWFWKNPIDTYLIEGTKGPTYEALSPYFPLSIDSSPVNTMLT